MSLPDEDAYENVMRVYSKNKTLSFKNFQQMESMLKDNPFALANFYLQVQHDLLKGIKRHQDGLEGYILGMGIKNNGNIESMSITDSLTGLKNHKGFEDDLAALIKRAEREGESSDKTIALIFCDLNNFKDGVNDKYGHEFGNDVLRYVASGLVQYTRAEDIRGRPGGDEFKVGINSLDKDAHFGCILQKLAYNLNHHIQRSIAHNHPGKNSNTTVTLGMSVYGIDAHTQEELNTHSDDAMFYAKKHPISTNNGPVNIHVYNPDMKKKYVTRDNRQGRG